MCVSVVVAWIVVLGAGAFLDEPFGGLLVVGYVYCNTGILSGTLLCAVFLFAVLILVFFLLLQFFSSIYHISFE